MFILSPNMGILVDNLYSLPNVEGGIVPFVIFGGGAKIYLSFRAL